MTTETIDIRIREDGARVVNRRIQDIGSSSEKSADGVDLLKKALSSLGGVLLAKQILEMVDTFTNLQNRLRATGIEGEVLTTVYNKLLAASNATRMSLQGSVELYSRLSASSKNLGVSQQQLIDFTTSLNQAVALSGATAHEAEAALIQLSQGMATGTLQSDELRSVLEQLPAVADVIAKSLGVTRGQLKQLGADGKISAQQILKAFQEARGELADRFAKTVPTMGQAFQVLKNNLIDAAGRLDQFVGVSTAIASGLLLLANNLDTVGSAVARAAQSLAVLVVTYGTFRAVVGAGELVAATREFLAYREAIASGNVVLLGSLEAERQKAAASLVSAEADKAAIVQTIARADAEGVAALATARSSSATAAAAVERIRWAQAQLVAERELEAVRLQAQINDIGRAQRLAAIAAIRKQELALTQALVLAERESAAAKATLAAASTAQNAQAAANAAALAKATQQVAAAQAGATAATAAAAGTTGLMAQAFAAVRTAATAALAPVGRLLLLINGNPFTVALTSLVAVIGALVVFGDKVDAGIDGITHMRDVLQAFGEQASSAFAVFSETVTTVFGGLVSAVSPALGAVTSATGKAIADWLSALSSFYSDVGTGFAGVFRGVARTFDAIGGLITGALFAIGRAFSGLPELVRNAFATAYNAAVGTIEDLINKTIDGLNKVRSVLGMDLIDAVQINRAQVDDQAWEKYGQSIANSMSDGFRSQGGFLEQWANGILDRAQQISRQRAVDEFRRGEKNVGADLTQKTKAAPIPVDEKAVKQAESALRSLLNTIQPSSGAVLELAKAHKVLDEAQKRGLITAAENNEYLRIARQHYQDIIDPLGKVNRELDEQTQLLRVSTNERSVEQEVLKVTNDLRQQGITLTEAETSALRTKLQAMQQLTLVTQAQDAMYADSIGKRMAFEAQLQALQNLSSNPAFTSGDRAMATADVLKGTGLDIEGTQVAIDAQVAQFEGMYARIADLRQKNLIDEQTAQQLNAKVALQQNEDRLKNTQSFFGNLAALSKSGNSKLAAIGRASAIAQATIDGVLAVQKALASAPPPVNYVLAAAVGAAAAANVSAIAKQGFMEGGYTGDAGRKEVAGVVHGKEFVVNADATQKNRPMLEAMNRGQDVGVAALATQNSVRSMRGYESGGYVGSPIPAVPDSPVPYGAPVTVVVNNNAEGTRARVEEREGPDGRELEVIIERVAAKSITSGGAVSSAIESQYGLNRAQGSTF